MNNAGMFKLQRIAYYLMTTDVTQDLMQGRYDACSLINRIVKEMRFARSIRRKT